MSQAELKYPSKANPSFHEKVQFLLLEGKIIVDKETVINPKKNFDKYGTTIADNRLERSGN